jgi:predicted ATP-dependent endonuclease of OLD family
MRSTDRGEILFLLDEPASNLHSTAQQKLLGTFAKLVTRCKLIYTTHSHHLINPEWLSGAYIVRNKNLNYDDEINFASEKSDIEAIPYRQFVALHPDQTTFFQPILDALEFNPGLLESIPSIVITEGKNDYYTLKYFNEVILGSKFPSIRFYPGAGKDKNDQVISLYLAWNREFKILLDGDKAGIKAKKRYIDIFGKEVEPKVFTLFDVDNSFNSAMEELFSDSDKMTIIHFYDPTAKKYDKSKFNTAIQLALIQKVSLNIGTSTITKVQKILSYLSPDPS